MKIKHLVIFITLVLFSSCMQTARKTEIKNIFSIDIGFDEDQIGFLKENNVVNPETLNAYSRDGFYYLTDSKNNKILKMTQNGISILIIYNPDFNDHLKPTIDHSNEDQTSETYSDIGYLKLYKEYEIFNPEAVCADINKNIYLVNKHPDYKKTAENGSLLEAMIIKFDKKGNFLYKLGNAGINTQPFGKIANILTDNKNNLMVQEYNQNGFNIYKFSEDGDLLNSVNISNRDIPITQKEKEYIINIIDVQLSNF